MMKESVKGRIDMCHKDDTDDKDAMKDIPKILSEHISDKDAKDIAEYYARQFARLSQFPTCLGQAIQAFEWARKLSSDDRGALEILFENLSKYINPGTTPDSVKMRMENIEACLVCLRKSKDGDIISKVISDLGGAFPSHLEYVVRVRP
jgi:hypothetical protein